MPSLSSELQPNETEGLAPPQLQTAAVRAAQNFFTAAAGMPKRSERHLGWRFLARSLLAFLFHLGFFCGRTAVFLIAVFLLAVYILGTHFAHLLCCLDRPRRTRNSSLCEGSGRCAASGLIGLLRRPL